jgi:hypothetical protein
MLNLFSTFGFLRIKSFLLFEQHLYNLIVCPYICLIMYFVYSEKSAESN